MKEYTISADDIFDFKKQLNEFFEANPTAQIVHQFTKQDFKKDRDWVEGKKLIASIIYEQMFFIFADKLLKY